MLYSMYLVINKIKNKKWLYLLIFFQIAIGISILSFSLNKYFNEKDKFEMLQNNLASQSILIEFNPSGEGITYEDYVYLNEKYSNYLELQYSLIGDLYTENIDSQIKIIFANEKELIEILGFYPQKTDCFIGEKALSYMSTPSNDNRKNNNILLIDGFLNIGDISLKLNDIPKLSQQKILSTNSTDILTNSEPILKAEDCLFIPLEYIFLRENIWPSNQVVLKPRLLIKEINNQSGYFWKVVDELYEIHKGEYTYNIGNETLQAREKLEEVTYNVKRYISIVSILLLLVSLSTSTLLYIIMHYRKKNIAIAMMLGSTLKRQIVELIMEISIVVILGVIFGISLSFFTSQYDQFFIRMNIETIKILILLTLAIIGVTSSISIGSLIKITPISMLEKV